LENKRGLHDPLIGVLKGGAPQTILTFLIFIDEARDGWVETVVES
jgi:hypothetical protein